MVLQQNKGVLEGNIFSKINQTIVIVGILQGRPLTILTRDEITLEQSTIELPDKTQVPGGRTNFGEFNITIHLAQDDHRNAMIGWFNQCLNRRGGTVGGRVGIDPNYKKKGTITYNRHFQGSPAAELQSAGAGTERSPFKLDLQGLWPKSIAFGEYSMSDGDEGDANISCTLALCYDDVEPIYESLA
jgi:hypothetical protein